MDWRSNWGGEKKKSKSFVANRIGNKMEFRTKIKILSISWVEITAFKEKPLQAKLRTHYLSLLIDKYGN